MFRFRPRFTLRTLAIVVTLFGAYLGAWQCTKENALGHSTKVHGHRKQREWKIISEGCAAPCFVWRNEYVPFEDGLAWPGYRRYYLWFFGNEFHLYERKLKLSEDPAETILHDHPFEASKLIPPPF